MNKIVVFSGAGISAGSGIQTFRDSNGLWENYAIEDVATPRAWKRNPALVLDFYNQRRKNIRDAKPNEAHLAAARWQDYFDVQVITQNIDDLHERAGSENVLHLHGEIFKMRSEKDPSLVYPVSGDILLGQKAEDGAQLRPHIVWFEEEVPMMEPAVRLAMECDLFLVVGTSLSVYPAASVLHYLPPHIPVFVLDKKIPDVRREDVVRVEKPAEAGIADIEKMIFEKFLK